MKEIGVELSSYHGGSLNGEDIKKVMNNATHIFDQFAAIFMEGKREGCQLMDADIDLMCLHYWEVFVLWDGAFSLARTINPMDEEAKIFQKFVLAAVHGTRQYDSSMPHHAKSTRDAEACEMADDKYSGWGLGDKMEDWVERLHQWGIATAPAISHSTEPPCSRTCTREGRLSQHPSRCARSSRCNAQRKQAKIVEEKG